MSDPLESARLKLRRATEHFQALNRDIDAFMRTDPYGLAPHLEVKGGWYVVKLAVVREPPLELGAVAGDAVGNLRAALDHLVYALSRTKPDGTGFPIFLDPDDYTRGGKRSHRERLLAGVPDADRAIIDGLQPYARRQKADPLWLLREFSNADKHRVVQPGFAKPRNFRIGRPAGADLELGPAPQGPLHDGAEVLTFRIVGQAADAQMQVPTEVDLTIGFGRQTIDAFDIQEMGADVGDIVAMFELRPVP